MLHSSRNGACQIVCPSLRNGALYRKRREKRHGPHGRCAVFSYYYYRLSLAAGKHADQEGSPSPSKPSGAGWSER